MSAVPTDVQCFDVERALAKALSIRVETYLVDPKANEYRFRIGARWNFRVDGDQLGQLWQDSDNPTVLRDTFETMKAGCLAFQTVTR